LRSEKKAVQLFGPPSFLDLFPSTTNTTNAMANFSNPESVTAAIAEVLNSTARSGWYYFCPFLGPSIFFLPIFKCSHILH
jgi:hypothetical protein